MSNNEVFLETLLSFRQSNYPIQSFFSLAFCQRRRLAMLRLTSKWTYQTRSSYAFLMSEILVSLLVMSEILVNVWQYCTAKVIKTTSPYILFKIQNFKARFHQHYPVYLVQNCLSSSSIRSGGSWYYLFWLFNNGGQTISINANVPN